MTPAASRYVLPFREITHAMLPVVGGKNAALGDMIRGLEPAGVRVPDGFATTADAYRLHLAEARLESEIHARLDSLDVRDVAALAETGRWIRDRVRSAPLPKAVAAEIRAAYEALSRRYGEAATDVAVRSSATAEDLPSASFAGQQETFLNVRGEGDLDAAVRSCMASLFTDRAIVYRAEHGFAHRSVALSVGVQKMVRSDLASSGVLFTCDTESGFRGVVVVTGAWGLGETIVQGRVRPDEFWVHKGTLEAGFRPIVRKELGEKALKLVYAEGGTKATREERVPLADRSRFVLSDDEVLTLARWGVAIERHFSARAGATIPMDVEWAKDGRSGEIFIVQARPETVHSQSVGARIVLHKLRGGAEARGRLLARGKSVGGKVGTGPVRIVASAAELPKFRDGEVLVAAMTDPDWEPVLARASAVVTDQGGRTCHAAIVSREIGIPCVVGTGDATKVLESGAEVTVSCAEGDEGKVYAGRVRYDVQEIDPSSLVATRVPLCLNVGNPDRAFLLAELPSAGVGLARIEFVVSSWIGVHPMALLHPERVADPRERAAVRERARGFEPLSSFFVERLASGVASIAAAFWPRPVVVRFSDFKTNEYAGLLGGAAFEPAEGNPMIGFRGASRYYHERYREAFALECAAIRRVRDEMGFSNVKVMVPFCRTVEEGRKVLAEMAANGLRRGERGLEVLVMCEIPSNVIQADEFADLFDGFSIGSNDLTQLALGIDRDSAILAPLFDERNPTVKRLVSMVVAAAHAKGKPVGICGQAPSDYPEFAAFLADIGIDSMSLDPDALPRVSSALERAK